MKQPPYCIFPVISNEKLSLRQVLDEDLIDLIDISFYDGVKAKTLEEAIVMNKRIDRDYENGNSIHWGILDIASNKILGTCGYYRAFDHEEGELGCVLLADYRGKGYMSAALQLAINFGLETIGLKRIVAITDQENEKAVNLLKRLGFIQKKLLAENGVEFELKKNMLLEYMK